MAELQPNLAHAAPQTEVEYRRLEQFPAYLVGRDGSVWSCWTQGKNNYISSRPVRQLKTQINIDGYRTVSLYRKGEKPSPNRVSVLVLEAFIGPRPDGMVACHCDGIKTNDAVENLRWDTQKGNAADRITHGTALFGERAPRAVLTDEIVMAIRRRLANGEKQAAIASQYGVSANTISALYTGVTWKHLPLVPPEAADREVFPEGKRTCLSWIRVRAKGGAK